MVARATVAETVGVVAGIVVPLVARGLIVRRPRVTALQQRLDVDARAVKRLQRLRRRYGPGPLRLRIPGRSLAVVLDARDARRVLEESPVPFSPATREKTAALRHFQPHAVLITDPPERPGRRALNERVLEPGRCHHLGEHFARVAGEEVDALLADAGEGAVVGYDELVPAYWRTVRRVVLGDGARDDTLVTDLLKSLRQDANWAYLKPRRDRVRARFDAELARHLARAEPRSLATLLPSDEVARGQVPHWLFAFDAAAIALVRATALLAAHPAELAAVQREADGGEREDGVPQHARAAVLEALRLWPTTPAVLREASEQTRWATGTLPAGTSFFTYAPFLHRDDERLASANSYDPSLWSGRPAVGNWPFVPFSAGPAGCPGRELVLLVTGEFLSRLVAARGLEPVAVAGVREGADLPGTLDPFGLRVRLTAPRSAPLAAV